MQKIISKPKEYSWGSPDFLPTVFGTEFTGKPQAELWFGTHPSSGTSFENGKLISEQIRLPFLLKLLSASEPLSLQVHPDKEQAAVGFLRENKLGLAADDPKRNYRDDQDKPEMLVALTEFHALSGLRSLPSVVAEFSGIESPAVAPLLDKLQGGFTEAFEWLLDEDNDMWELVDAISSYQKTANTSNARAGRIIAQTHPGDRGIVVSYLLNYLQLSPGEAIYLPAGNLHAYLQGSGVEIMAPSDNVIRARFSQKHMDIPEALKIIDFEPLLDPVLKPDAVADEITKYAPAGAPFVLYRVGNRANNDIELPITGNAVALVLSGRTTLEDADGSGQVSGPSAWLLRGDTIKVNSGAEVFIATGVNHN